MGDSAIRSRHGGVGGLARAGGVGPLLALVLALVLVLAACSGGTGHHAAAAPTTADPTTAPPPTDPSGPTFPLTGTAAADATRLARPALSVKVDNAPPARPQAGLNQADIVTEALVEGGLTRFFATYQSQDAPLVGPVRSARPVDADLLRELNGGFFAYSGAAAGEIAPVRDHSSAVLLSDEAGDPGFHRSHDRSAPYNLYVSTPSLYDTGQRRAAAAHLSAPPALFNYTKTAPGPPSATPAKQVSLHFGIRSSSSWDWNAGSPGLYERIQDGSADTLADGSRITADNIVILSVAIRGTGIFDTAHEEDPLVVVIGSGKCWVMRDGVLQQGTWQRSSYSVPVKLVGADGQPLTLHRGRTWLELLPDAASPQFG